MATNYNSHPFGLLTYTAPSDKYTRRANGLLTKWTAGTELPFEWDASGVLQGVLVETQRTNLALRSDDITHATYGDAAEVLATTANSIAAPDGNTTADTLSTTTTANSYHYRQQVVTTTNGVQYTHSVFVKPKTGDGKIWILGQNSTRFAYFNVSAGTIEQATISAGHFDAATITAFANGWYRCTATWTKTAATGGEGIGVGFYSSSGTPTTAPAGAGAQEVYVWGFQLEVGGFASSYIPTTSATVTRAADAITLAASDVPVSTSAGTLFAEIKTSHTDYSLGISVNANDPLLMLSATTRVATAYQDDGSNDWTVTTGNASAAGDVAKLAVGYQSGSIAACLNGGTVATASTVYTPVTPTTFYFGFGDAAYTNGYLRKVMYLPRRMTNAELQALTT